VDGSWLIQGSRSITWTTVGNACQMYIPNAAQLAGRWIAPNDSLACPLGLPTLTPRCSQYLWQVFLVKNILVLVMIVMAAQFSLYLDPTIPPLLGGRCLVQIFAMVLVSLRSQEDLEDAIGAVHRLLWWDLFN
jgi:hypothetical protein